MDNRFAINHFPETNEWLGRFAFQLLAFLPHSGVKSSLSLAISSLSPEEIGSNSGPLLESLLGKFQGKTNSCPQLGRVDPVLSFDNLSEQILELAKAHLWGFVKVVEQAKDLFR